MQARTRELLDRIAAALCDGDDGRIALVAPPGRPRAPDRFVARFPTVPAMPVWNRAAFDRALDAAVARAPAAWDHAVLVVDQNCEMACRFCPEADRDRSAHLFFQAGAEEQLADLLHQLERARMLGVETVDIGGNDVLRFPLVLRLLDGAGALGFRRIIAQSPGLVLADRAFAEAVARTPLDELCLPIYGDSAAVHDAVTGTPGAFDRLCRALDHLRELGRPSVRLHTIALGSTLDRLDALIAFAEERFGLPLRVTPLRPNRLGEREHLADTARFADLGDLVARRPWHFVEEFPLCLFPPAIARAKRHRLGATAGRRSARVHLYDLGMYGEEHARLQHERNLHFPAACDGCLLQPLCPGVLGAYLDRFGASEVRPARDPLPLEEEP
jgi:MoaA/NifB/PqqE/SkfB family radical SAM enzyme